GLRATDEGAGDEGRDAEQDECQGQHPVSGPRHGAPHLPAGRAWHSGLSGSAGGLAIPRGGHSSGYAETVPAGKRPRNRYLGRREGESGDGSRAAQDGVEGEAPERVRPWAPEVAKQFGVVAPGVLEGIRQDREFVPPPPVVDRPRQLD